MFYRTLLVGFFMLFCFKAFSQDTIVRTNNDTIRAYIVDITKDKIKFIFNDAVDAQIFEIRKSLVKQIIFEDGTKLTIISNPYEVSNNMGIPERKHAIKAAPTGLLMNHFTIGYEMKLRKALNLELKGGVIGTNINTAIKHSEGWVAHAALKFVELTDSYKNGLKYIQPLHGSYLKPEIIFTQFTQDDEFRKINFTSYVLNAVFGNQRVYNNKWLIDYFAGLGIGIQNSSKEADLTYEYSHLYFGKKIPIVVTAGIFIGLVY